jgi:hypothetical protein
MKTSHRSRKNVKTAQSGGIGAPLLGVFAVYAGYFNPTTFKQYFVAYTVDEENTQVLMRVWTPNKEISKDSVIVTVDDQIVDPISVEISADGQQIAVELPEPTENFTVSLKPGHPALIGENGTQCGGSRAVGNVTP